MLGWDVFFPSMVTLDWFDWITLVTDFGATSKVAPQTFSSLRLSEKRRTAAWSRWPIAFGNGGKPLYLDSGDLDLKKNASKLYVSSLVMRNLKIIISICGEAGTKHIRWHFSALNLTKSTCFFSEKISLAVARFKVFLPTEAWKAISVLVVIE